MQEKGYPRCNTCKKWQQTGYGAMEAGICTALPPHGPSTTAWIASDTAESVADIYRLKLKLMTSGSYGCVLHEPKQ